VRKDILFFETGWYRPIHRIPVAKKRFLFGESMKQKLGTQVKVRRATVDDTEAIRRMQAASWLDTYPNDVYGISYAWVKEYTDNWLTPDQLERSRGYVEAAINDPKGFYRVAERGGEIVGFIHAATKADDTKELEAIYIHPDLFGGGLGHRMMMLVQDWADGVQMSLEVAVYNERAIRFYERHGFERIAGTEYLHKDNIPVEKMIRKGGAMIRPELYLFENSETCRGVGVSGGADISHDVIEITGRYPEEGAWARNRKSQEQVIIAHGVGNIILRGQENFPLDSSSRDNRVVVIEPGQWFAWDGKMAISMICRPSFSPDQYEVKTEHEIVREEQ